MNQHSIIQDLVELYPNQVRFDCPGCGRSNSLSVHQDAGLLSWYCFGNTCTFKGRTKLALSIESIISRRQETIKDIEFKLPDYFTTALDKEACRTYLMRNHSWDAAVSERITLRYDPKQDRCVFLIYDDSDTLVNATGRALQKGIIPKWYKYGSSNYPLICGNKDTACIVEDCASAAAISTVVTGIAILGTNFSENIITPLRKYKKLMLALDKDALRKALAMQRTLEYYAETTTYFLDEDLKTMDDAHIREFIGSKIDLSEVEDL